MEEFRDRQQRAAAKAQEKGLAGLVVWSRCGTSVDYFGDIYYLTKYYSQFAVIQDRPPLWNGRGHSILLLPIDAEPILITDQPEWEENPIAVDDVRFTMRVLDTVAAALKETGLDGGRIGIVGRQSLLATSRDGIEAALGHRLDFEFADEILEQMRMVKSPEELDLMRHSSDVGNRWMSTMMEAVEPGRTEGEIIGEGLRFLAANNGWPYDIAVASGEKSGLYGRVGVPSWDSTRKLETGDLVHIDGWGPIDMYFADLFRSTVVGRKATPAQREVLEGSVGLIHGMVEGIRPGVTVGEIYARGATWLIDNGFAPHQAEATDTGTKFGELLPAFGHCLGLGIEPPWLVENEPTVLVEGMVVAVESMVGRPGVGAAGLEEIVIVTSSGTEVLTAGCPVRWWD